MTSSISRVRSQEGPVGEACRSRPRRSASNSCGRSPNRCGVGPRAGVDRGDELAFAAAGHPTVSYRYSPRAAEAGSTMIASSSFGVRPAACLGRRAERGRDTPDEPLDLLLRRRRVRRSPSAAPPVVVGRTWPRRLPGRASRGRATRPSAGPSSGTTARAWPPGSSSGPRRAPRPAGGGTRRSTRRAAPPRASATMSPSASTARSNSGASRRVSRAGPRPMSRRRPVPSSPSSSRSASASSGLRAYSDSSQIVAASS